MKAASRGNFPPAEAAECAAGAFRKKTIAPAPRGGQRAVLITPPDMTLPLASWKKAPRPWRRPRRGDGGFPRGRSGESADCADFHRRKSAQSADNLPVGRFGGTASREPTGAATEFRRAAKEPGGTASSKSKWTARTRRAGSCCPTTPRPATTIPRRCRRSLC